jgi:hypothetical protein
MSQQQTFNTGSGSGAVNQVTGTNGVTASPISGNVVVSGVNATTSTVGVASFNPANFTVNGSGEVSALAVGSIPWTDEAVSFAAASNNGYFCTAPLTVTLPAAPAQGDTISIAIDYATTPGNAVIVQANTGQTIRTSNMDTSTGGTATNSAQGDALSLVYRAASDEWFSLSTEGSWFLV